MGLVFGLRRRLEGCVVQNARDYEFKTGHLQTVQTVYTKVNAYVNISERDTELSNQ